MKLAITPDHYRNVLETARAKDPGLAAALELSGLMGLRSQEAVQSVQSLKTWRQALDRGVWHQRRGDPVGRSFLMLSLSKKALDNALAVSEDRHGRLIDKPDLKTAMKYWHSQASRLGLTGYGRRGTPVPDARRFHLSARKRHNMRSTHFCATTREIDFLYDLTDLTNGGNGPDFVSEINLAPAGKAQFAGTDKQMQGQR
ncbi:DNA-binding prophage protein [Salmonella enterica subsp. salamae]|uniref:DNA-binding prophage protein n=1 Tax=Salmonella enterica subsp. salamae TaxID=59202 RepID=A0A6D2G8E1_SALER|nr:DNA-binding prophage protein [Salmonella enterica subsp. salamae]